MRARSLLLVLYSSLIGIPHSEGGLRDEWLSSESGSRQLLQQAGSMISSGELAVLPSEFSRSLNAAWQNTTFSSANGGSQQVGNAFNITNSRFLSFDNRFADLIDQTATLSILAAQDYKFAHEGAVYLPNSNEVFFASDRLGDETGPAQYIRTFAIDLSSGQTREINTSIPLINGAASFGNGIAIAAQGNEEEPSGVAYLDPYTGDWNWILNNWFGLMFNSPNDVVQTSDGAIWFTDPTYGNFRGSPQLGEYVWRYLPGGPPARVMADGLSRPNGLQFTADERTLYISDTGFITGNSSQANDPLQPHTIYAYDVLSSGSGSFLANKRVFAVSDSGIPDTIRVDGQGNVWSNTGDGLSVWAPSGDLIGKVFLEDAGSFCFVGENVYVLAETEIYRVSLRN